MKRYDWVKLELLKRNWDIRDGVLIIPGEKGVLVTRHRDRVFLEYPKSNKESNVIPLRIKD